MYLIDESSSRLDGFINTGSLARAKNYHACRAVASNSGEGEKYVQYVVQANLD